MRIITRHGKGDVMEHQGVTYEADHDGVFDVPPHVADELLRFKSQWTTPGHLAEEKAEAERSRTTLETLREENEKLRAEMQALRAEMKPAAKPRRAPAAKR